MFTYFNNVNGDLNIYIYCFIMLATYTYMHELIARIKRHGA